MSMRPGHTANSCSADPPKSTISVARRDSRSTLGSPVCGDRALQLIEQLRIDRIDRIDQRRHGGARRGTEKPAHGVVRARALYLLSSNPCAIDECPAVPLALDQSLAAKPIDDLRNRRVDQTLRFTEQSVNVANGSRAEFPELRQDGIFQFVGR